MIRYRYNDDLHPPAPFVHVNVRNTNVELPAKEFPAQLDIGAIEQ